MKDYLDYPYQLVRAGLRTWGDGPAHQFDIDDAVSGYFLEQEIDGGPTSGQRGLC